MGVSAGRILLIPKGDWVNDTTYEMLDWVRHNETSWVCKKNCTGIEPSEENSENWFLIAKDGEGISSIIDMVGATADTDGVRGFVPAPKAGDEKKALLGDGTWGTVDAMATTLTGTLTVGKTTITLTDASITTNSTIDIYTDVYGVNPKNVSVEDGSLTLEFSAQESDVQVKVVVS